MNNDQLRQKLAALAAKFRNLENNYNVGATDADPEYDNGRESGARGVYGEAADEIEAILK